jgi:hypothetical protein
MGSSFSLSEVVRRKVWSGVRYASLRRESEPEFVLTPSQVSIYLFTNNSLTLKT